MGGGGPSKGKNHQSRDLIIKGDRFKTRSRGDLYKGLDSNASGAGTYENNPGRVGHHESETTSNSNRLNSLRLKQYI